jgi:predicted lactoylglutathione lyase
MTRMIFVNLPVTDLAASRRFYEALGFVNEPRFTDETAAAMILTDAIAVMILTHEKWATFTDRPIPPAGSSEVSLAIGCEDRAEVDRMVEAGRACGGAADINPPQDHGFMYQRTIVDPDGHLWEPMWMDPAVASGEAQPEIAH